MEGCRDVPFWQCCLFSQYLWKETRVGWGNVGPRMGWEGWPTVLVEGQQVMEVGQHFPTALCVPVCPCDTQLGPSSATSLLDGECGSGSPS